MEEKKLGSVGLGGRTLYGELFAEENWKKEVKNALKPGRGYAYKLKKLQQESKR